MRSIILLGTMTLLAGAVPAFAETAEPLSVDYVIGMLEAGMPQDAIVSRIRDGRLAFVVRRGDIDRLLDAGAGEDLLMAVLQGTWTRPRRLDPGRGEGEDADGSDGGSDESRDGGDGPSYYGYVHFGWPVFYPYYYGYYPYSYGGPVYYGGHYYPRVYYGHHGRHRHGLHRHPGFGGRVGVLGSRTARPRGAFPRGHARSGRGPRGSR